MAARKDKKKKKQWRLTEMGERSRVEGEERYGREEGGRGGRRRKEEGGGGPGVGRRGTAETARGQRKAPDREVLQK